MPSIRVKGRTYTPLSDVFPDARSRPASSATSHDAVVASPEAHPLNTRKSLPQVPDETGTTTIPGRRPRATTSASRIHTHCTDRSSRATWGTPNSPGSPGSPLRNSNITSTTGNAYNNLSAVHAMEGQQSDVRSSHGDHGLVESSINLSFEGDLSNDGSDPFHHHHDDVVEHLDVIDPQVGVFANLTNTANSILIPPSNWYSRKPVVVLPSVPRRDSAEDGDQYEDSLDRHVDDLLKRPSKFKRTLMGIWSFLKTPMGMITGIYGFLVVFWGAAIVFFLAKIINLHNANTQGFWVEISSQVETGLFTVTSIGLIPSRVLDTYRIYKIWSYKRKTIRLRKKAGLPQLFDVDDLPDPMYDPNYVHVLTEEEQADLHRQQRKFQYSQTWYRAHGTDTHRAFPISTALWICFLNDGNSIFQIFLCGTMWGLNRFQRPAWTTGILIPAGFLCGIGAAVLIWRGGERTKRVEKVRERLQAALAQKHHLLPEEHDSQDGHLEPALSRNSRPAMGSEMSIIKETNEPTPRPTLELDPVVDEHMTVPSAEKPRS